MFFTVLIEFLLFTLISGLSQHPILIIVSYDAFRHNFFEKNATPHMLKLREKGTYADFLYNVFPTKTFPNHHSISTGLHPDKHGVVGNSFYNSATKKIVNFGYEMFHYNESVIPIWRLNEMNGDKRYSGSMMWPGGSFKYQGKLPTHMHPFQPGLDWQYRVDTALRWIEDPHKPANLVMLYFEEPDSHGHAFGPESKEVFQFLQKLDNITNYLQQQLVKKKLVEKVNVIHLSDHGMSTVTPPNFIDITQFLPNNSYELAGSSPTLHVIPHEGYEEEVLMILQNVSKTVGHFNVYEKEHFPKRWRYNNPQRSPPIFLLADDGYAFQDFARNAEEYAKITNLSEFGIHGYENVASDMLPFFMARGPQIKESNKVPPFDTVDLFTLFCAILQIPSTPNDGSYDKIKDVLVGYHGSILPIIVIIVGATLLALLLILCAAVVTLLIIKRQQNITTAAALNKRFPQNFSHSNIEAQHLLEPEDA